MFALWRSYRYLETLLSNFPRYVSELHDCRSWSDFYYFVYYKLPHIFRLSAFPAKITLEITNLCNFGCPHCHRVAANKASAEGYMLRDHLDSIVKQVGMHPFVILKIGGNGEPALHPYLDDFMRGLKATSVRAVLYTNGTLFKNYTATQIIDWRLNSIVVSVDGFDSVSFARRRLGGDYEELFQLLSAFYSEKRRCKLRHPIVDINHVIFPSDTSQHTAHFARTWRPISDTISFGQLVPRKAPKSKLSQFTVPKGAKCPRIYREMSILTDGSIPVCGPLYRQKGRWDWIGHVETGVAVSWSHPEIARTRTLQENHDFSELEHCRKCLLSTEGRALRA